MTAKKRSKKNKRTRRVVWILLILLVLLPPVIYLGYKWWRESRSKFVKYPAFGISMPETYPIHGIDVSRYQETIAWEEVKAMQVKNIKIGFAFIKATEGISDTDKQFKRNWKKAKQNGVTRGAYHYFHPTKDGRAQAQNFIKTVTLDSGDLPPVVDIEVLNGVPAATMRKELKEWLVIVEDYYKVKPIIYTNVDYYSNWLKKEFDGYPLWAAHYFTYTEPRINRGWIFWQHSDQGRVNGIFSRVDFNVFNGDSLAFRNLLVD